MQEQNSSTEEQCTSSYYTAIYTDLKTGHFCP